MKSHTTSIFLVLVFLPLCLSTSTAQSETTITLTYENVDSFPWSMKDGSGIDLILLKMVDEAMPNVSFKYVQAPWKRCLNNIGTGTTEGCFTASFKEKRLQFGFYPGTHIGNAVDPNLMLHASSYSLYILKDSTINVPEKMKISGLNGKIAAPAGYSIGGDLQSAGYSVDASASKTTNNFEKLLLNRVKAVAALTLNGNNILVKHKKYADSIKVVTTPLVNKPYYLMFSKQFIKKDRALAESIWSKAAEIREGQEFKDKAGEFLSK
ncbi:hypothetical protein A9Q99_18040 [Gammaproteobacteria bacterium 45_16_T64]|nr:hypothetical protein A9Q99_18040 [Gammaproteobacteria bacterium 45_16_T64]